ncbi:MAG TPA: sigma-70 family RNA polymerase sigma factor [Gaiellaceae bacterium]|jgi:RNA polymerase sigma-70 factor (ECF subfamily)
MAARKGGASLDELRAVYERKLPELRRVAAAIVRDRELACDVVQDAFVRAVRQRQTFDGRGSLDGWVWRIVVNVARDSRADRPSEAVDRPSEDVASAATDARRDHVRSAVEQLPERQRLVLFLRYYADLDYRSIAEALAITDGTVAATLNAAHSRLRGLLAEVAR